METPLISSFANFELAVQAVLKCLHDQIGFQLWIFTRVEGENWIVLESRDYGYDVHNGDVLKWSDSFCSRMVQGLGPRVATNSQEITAYLEAPISQVLPIKAYIGMPISHKDGTLFGTLCAIDPFRQPDLSKEQVELIELQSQLLTTILHFELEKQENLRLYERAAAEAQRDILTGIYNRRGWENLLLFEESRCQRYAHSAGVIVIDLDDLKKVNDQQGHNIGDRLIQNTAYHLCQTVRQADVVARLGGDEFVVLMVEITPEGTQKIAERIQAELAENDIQASVGWAMRLPKSTLQLTVNEADQKMYQQKSKRKQLIVKEYC